MVSKHSCGVSLQDQAKIERLIWFLNRIAEAAGPFKRDPYEHARAVIEESVNLARAALYDPLAGTDQVDWDGRSFDPEIEP